MTHLVQQGMYADAPELSGRLTGLAQVAPDPADTAIVPDFAKAPRQPPARRSA